MITFKKCFIVGTNDSGLKDTMNGMVICELVRCRDCANYDDNKNYCNVWQAKNQPNDGFCHFAERKRNVKPDTAE